jgi:hypothetical protein
MAYHPRIETSTIATLQTTRCRNSELWFVNNRKLEEAILGYAAKYAERYAVKLYALAIEGNHVQGPALFPNANRAHFMRDLNSSIARAVPRFTNEYTGGRLWGRRYSAEFLPGAQDVEHYFFYTVLQPVQDGLVDKISEYPGYNCFYDAVRGIRRKFKVVRWAEYNAALRYNSEAKISDYIDWVWLEYARLPGYEDLERGDYVKLMTQKLEEYRQKVLESRKAAGSIGFVGREGLKEIKRGARPFKTKTSTIESRRPRVLSICPNRRAETSAWYFSTIFNHSTASALYRAGQLDAVFPEGTYRPYLRTGSSPPDE